MERIDIPTRYRKCLEIIRREKDRHSDEMPKRWFTNPTDVVTAIPGISGISFWRLFITDCFRHADPVAYTLSFLMLVHGRAT